jgi:acetyl-CoA carboxylase biotin carboxyl carrier protein
MICAKPLYRPSLLKLSNTAKELNVDPNSIGALHAAASYLRELQNLIKFVAKSGASEVSLETEDFKITIKTTETGSIEPTYVQMPMAQPSPAMSVQSTALSASPVEVAVPVVSDDAKYVVVKSPMIGTFYRKPSPDKPSFVEVGTSIKSGDVLCVIEAMKLFNEIESEISGKIIKVLVDDTSPVEFDQPLFLVDPS